MIAHTHSLYTCHYHYYIECFVDGKKWERGGGVRCTHHKLCVMCVIMHSVTTTLSGVTPQSGCTHDSWICNRGRWKVVRVINAGNSYLRLFSFYALLFLTLSNPSLFNMSTNPTEHPSSSSSSSSLGSSPTFTNDKKGVGSPRTGRATNFVPPRLV